MLGYITADKPELKVREMECYRSYYCGICKSVGARYGQLPRFALSYDFAFLALLLASLSPEPEQVASERCIVHPLKKNTVTRGNPCIDYAGDIMVLLVYYNLLDDKADEHKVRGTLGSRLLADRAAALQQKYPKLAEVIDRELGRLTELEQEKSASIDLCGDAFAGIMAEVFAGEAVKELVPEEQLRPLRHIGYNIGRWIYLADALDDCGADIKSGSYNPLIWRFKYEGGEETIESFRERISEQMEIVLMSCLSEVELGYSLLRIAKNKGVTDNVIYSGLLKKTESLLRKGSRDDEKSL